MVFICRVLSSFYLFICFSSGASQPYHACVSKVKRASSPKHSRKSRGQIDSKLTAITESGEGEDGPIDESKDLQDSLGMNEGKDGIDLINGMDGNGLEGESESSLGNMDTTAFTATDSGIDYTKNTPLLWATHCGHLRVIWLLLSDGYSPNDVDKMMNNAVHLAAAYGDVKILQVLINDGGNANAVNYYKNKPIDMAKNKAVRDMVAIAMETGASMTDDDRRVKHEQNLRQVSVKRKMFVVFIPSFFPFSSFFSI
jgi:hypothetical protein